MKKKSFALSLLLVGIILSSLLVLSGCIDDPPLPPGYVSIDICSGGSNVYGEVYINRNRIPNVYLNPNRCLYSVWNGPTNVEILIEIKDEWGRVHSRYFTPSSWNTRVTIN